MTETSTNVKVYISRHNLVTDEIFNMVKDMLLNIECEVTYYERGNTYSNIPIKECDLIVVLPWWDEMKYKLGKGTITELNVALQLDKHAIFYRHPDGMYSKLGEVHKSKSEDWKFVGYLEAGEQANIPELIESIREHVLKHGRPELEKDDSNEDVSAVV